MLRITPGKERRRFKSEQRRPRFALLKKANAQPVARATVRDGTDGSGRPGAGALIPPC